MPSRVLVAVMLLLAATACVERPSPPEHDAQQTVRALAPSPSVVAPSTVASVAPTPDASAKRPWCRDDSESAALKCAGILARRSGDTLLLVTSAGLLPLVNHEDSESEETTLHYRYVGTLRSAGLAHVVEESGYEITHLMLHDSASTRAMGIASEPLLSPDGAHFAASISEMSVCEAQSARLEIWGLVKGGPRLEWSVDPWDCGRERGWEPEKLVWTSADTLRFTHVSGPPAPGDDPQSLHRAMVVRRTGKWTLIDPAR